MKTFYPIYCTIVSLLIVILCPINAWKEYVMFGLLILMISINRWEYKKILKKNEINTNNEGKTLTIPDINKQHEFLISFMEELSTSDIELIKQYKYEEAIKSIKKNL